MAVDVREAARAREGGQLQGSSDARVMRRVTIIVGGALGFLVALKLGFLKHVMP